jgi:hypothetical protein
LTDEAPGAKRRVSAKALRLLALAAVAAAFLATVFTVPASAQPHRVTVQLADGTVTTVILDLPEGTLVEDVVGHPDLPGTPISLEALEPEPPAPEPPAPDGEPGDPPVAPPPGWELPPGPAPAPGEPAVPGDVDTGAGTPRGDGGLTERPLTVIDERELDGSADRPRRKRWVELVRDDGGTLRARRRGRRAPLRTPDGAPTVTNPGFTSVLPGSAVLPGPATAVGVPNFIIQKFRVPPFLLPIYQAAAIE